MLKNLNKRKKKKGFTLIELVIVLAVLAIIALIAIPNFNKVRTDSQKKADDSTCDVIERVTQMAIADGYFEVNKTKTGKIVINPAGADTSKKIITSEITFTDASAVGVKDGGIDKYEEALKEVKVPQEKLKKSYLVTLSADDKVTDVETIQGITIP